MKSSGFWWVPSSQEESKIAAIKGIPDAARPSSTWGYRDATGIYATAKDLDSLFHFRTTHEEYLEKASASANSNNSSYKYLLGL